MTVVEIARLAVERRETENRERVVGVALDAFLAHMIALSRVVSSLA